MVIRFPIVHAIATITSTTTEVFAYFNDIKASSKAILLKSFFCSWITISIAQPSQFASAGAYQKKWVKKARLPEKYEQNFIRIEFLPKRD